jgi:hypothetical protein
VDNNNLLERNDVRYSFMNVGKISFPDLVVPAIRAFARNCVLLDLDLDLILVQFCYSFSF